MVNFLTDNLRFLGLNEKEVKVFTTLSVFGRLNMTNISSRSSLSRTTVDAIVRRLINQGLVTQERVQGHFEYRVLLDVVADKLAWIEQRLRADKNSEEKIAGPLLRPADMSTGIPDIGLDDATYRSLEQYFSTRAGERVRMLFAMGNVHNRPHDLMQDVAELIELGIRHDLHTEVLLCKTAADMIRTEVDLRSVRDGVHVMLNIVPSIYCQAMVHILVFRDVVVLLGQRHEFVRVVTDTVLVETMKHLLAIACETGWSVSYQAWVGDVVQK